MNAMLAAFAAAASPSISAPASLACRRLMIDAYPICFNPGTAVAVVAPAHAIVVSTREKFVTPGTVSFVTLCAFSVTASAARVQASNGPRCCGMGELHLMKGAGDGSWKDGLHVRLALPSCQREAVHAVSGSARLCSLPSSHTLPSRVRMSLNCARQRA